MHGSGDKSANAMKTVDDPAMSADDALTQSDVFTQDNNMNKDTTHEKSLTTNSSLNSYDATSPTINNNNNNMTSTSTFTTTPAHNNNTNDNHYQEASSIFDQALEIVSAPTDDKPVWGDDELLNQNLFMEDVVADIVFGDMDDNDILLPPSMRQYDNDDDDDDDVAAIGDEDELSYILGPSNSIEESKIPSSIATASATTIMMGELLPSFGESLLGDDYLSAAANRMLNPQHDEESKLSTAIAPPFYNMDKPYFEDSMMGLGYVPHVSIEEENGASFFNDADNFIGNSTLSLPPLPLQMATKFPPPSQTATNSPQSPTEGISNPPIVTPALSRHITANMPLDNPACALPAEDSPNRLESRSYKPCPPRRRSCSSSASECTTDSKCITDSALWSIRFAELEKFKQQYGHCNVPQKYEENTRLGAWVARQRFIMRRCESGASEDSNDLLYDERVEKLKDLGLEASLGKSVWLWLLYDARLSTNYC